MEIKKNKNFRLAIVQHRAERPEQTVNTETALKFMREAAADGADMVLFPECFLTSYKFPEFCEKAVEQQLPVSELAETSEYRAWYDSGLTEESEPFKRICEEARTLHMGVVVTGLSKGKERLRNTAWLIGRNGEILLKYNKVHTCDFSLEQYLESGDRFDVCQFDDICVGIMICYDREYPESARELAIQGAELILVPNDCTEMRPRLMELQVRAMENMTGIAMANPPGKAGGASCAYHPMVWDYLDDPAGCRIAEADEMYDGLVWAEFDMEAIRKYRDREDLGKYRKTGAYKHLA